MSGRRIARADAISVAESLIYDPGCPVCTEERTGEHPEHCAMRAVARILAAAEVDGS